MKVAINKSVLENVLVNTQPYLEKKRFKSNHFTSLY